MRSTPPCPSIEAAALLRAVDGENTVSLIGALAFAALAQVHGQSAISGLDLVLKSKSGQMPNGQSKISTDAAGAFTFAKLPAGEYTLALTKDSVKKRGAQGQEIKVDIFQPKRLRSLHAERVFAGVPILWERTDQSLAKFLATPSRKPR